MAQQRESQAAKAAYIDYLNLEGRSLDKLARVYQDRAARIPANPPPTQSLLTLKDWSRHYDWASRIREFEQRQTTEAEAAVAQARRDVFTRGLALDYERVRVLQDMALKLLVTFRKLDLETASERRIATLIAGIDRVLDSIAKETGGRQPGQTVAFFLRDYARQHASEFGLSETEALNEVEALLAEFRIT